MMPLKTCRQVLDILEPVIKEFGGRVKFVENIPKGAEAPFSNNVGLNWKKGIFYVLKSLNQDSDGSQASELIHEMGHLFACGIDPKKGDGEDEIAFLGWEIALAKKLGVWREWDSQNKHYIIDTNSTAWGDLKPRQKAAHASAFVKKAKKNGTVEADGTPINAFFNPS